MTTVDLRPICKPDMLLGLMIAAEKNGWRDSIVGSERNHSIKIIDLVYFIDELKKLDETEEFFPCGKWATIQHLQSIVRLVS